MGFPRLPQTFILPLLNFRRRKRGLRHRFVTLSFRRRSKFLLHNLPHTGLERALPNHLAWRFLCVILCDAVCTRTDVLLPRFMLSAFLSLRCPVEQHMRAATALAQASPEGGATPCPRLWGGPPEFPRVKVSEPLAVMATEAALENFRRSQVVHRVSSVLPTAWISLAFGAVKLDEVSLWYAVPWNRETCTQSPK